MSIGEREVLITVGAQSKSSPHLRLKGSLRGEELARKSSGGWSCHAKELNDQAVIRAGKPETGAFVHLSVAKALGSVRIMGMWPLWLLSVVLDVRWKKFKHSRNSHNSAPTYPKGSVNLHLLIPLQCCRRLKEHCSWSLEHIPADFHSYQMSAACACWESASAHWLVL